MADDFDVESTEQADDPKASLLAEALKRFKLTDEAEAEQRKLELDDLAFVDLEEQWPADIKAQRAGTLSGASGAPPVPARPCLTINLLKQPVQQVVNQQRSAKLALSFAPRSDEANQETAEAMEDIVRFIQAESRAQLARGWAFQRAAKCGRGYYRILTDYANDGDFDLDIIYKRIPNQAAVYFDPFCQEPDFSDAEWCFITEDVPLERFKRLYPGSQISKMDQSELMGLGDRNHDWIKSTDTEDVTIRVAEYFYIEHREERVKKAGRERVVDRRQVKWCKLTAAEILEEQDWDGRFIPVVPVIGDEFNVNGKRRWAGVVRSAKDSNRAYNFMTSAQVETVGLAPRAPFIVVEGQLEGYEAMWEQANTRNFPYLVTRPVAFGGAQAPLPQRNSVEPPIQAITLAKHEANSDVKATTGIFDPSLGNLSPSDRSGKAILALQKQAEMGTSGFLDNLAQMSMVLEGKILRDLIPKVYDRPGRIVAALGADDQKRSIMVGMPYVDSAKGPQAVDPHAPPPEGKVKLVDLTKGEYAVSVSVSKGYTTKREEASALMGELIQAAPQLAPVISDLWVENMDFPGARAIADRLKKTLPPNLQDNPETDNIPPKVATTLQQQGQMIDLLTKELNARRQAMETDQIKHEYEMAKAKDDNATKLKIAEIQAQTQFGVAEIKALMDDYKLRLAHIESQMGHEAEARRLESEQSHQMAIQANQQSHDATMGAAKMGADLVKQQGQQAHEATQAQQQMGHEAQMAAQQQATEREDMSQ